MEPSTSIRVPDRGRRRAALAAVPLAIALSFSAWGGGGEAAAPRTLSFRIPPQPVANALNAFASQADITLVFSVKRVRNRQASGLEGDYAVVDGLERLLQGTGLTFKQINDSTIAIDDAFGNDTLRRDAGGASSDETRADQRSL